MALGMGGSGSNINGAMSETVSLTVAVLMSVIGGWNALWQELADQARPALLGLPVAAREAPVEIKFRETRTDGDSLVRRLTLSDVVILGQARGQDWTWRAGEVIVEMRPAEAGRFSVLMPSPQHLEMSGPLGRGALVLWAVNLSAEVTLDETGLVREAVARGEGLTLTGMGMDSLAQSMVIALARDGDLTKINIDLTEIDMPAPARFADPVGAVVQRASLDAWVTGLGPPAPDHGRVGLEVGELARARDGTAVHLRFDALDAPGEVGDGRVELALASCDALGRTTQLPDACPEGGQLTLVPEPLADHAEPLVALGEIEVDGLEVEQLTGRGHGLGVRLVTRIAARF